MVLIFTYSDYTVYAQSWTFAGLTVPSNTTLLGFINTAGGGASITLNKSRGDVEAYIRTHTDADGFVDLRPLQA